MRTRSFVHAFVLTGAALLMAVLTTGCGDSQAPATADAAPRQTPSTRVETLVLEPTSFTDVIELTGNVEAIYDATLSAQASGTVMSIAELGAYIPKGGRVAQLDSTEAHAALEQTQARYELAQDRYERQEPLYRDSIITALEFEQVRSELTQARAARSQAEERLRNTRVTVPFSGTVEERFIQPGEQVAPNDPVARVINVRPAKVVAGIPERYAGDIEKGTAVQVRFRTAQLGERTGIVTFVGSAIDPESRTFTIEATIPNEDRAIKPEMVAQLQLDRTTIEDALVIPRPAVVRDEAGTHVYTVTRTDTAAVAQKRSVVLGPSTGARITVASGLEAGDEVVIVGQSNLAPGQPVEVTDRYTRIPAAGTPYETGVDTTTAPPAD
jgi:RND family efflux transporter MFP subunit